MGTSIESRQQPYYERNNCNNKQDVDESTTNAKTKTKQP
jgi:hypothetical protein